MSRPDTEASSGVELRKLRYFVAVAAEANFGRPAAAPGRVTTFNQRPHLPHFERVGTAAGRLDVLSLSVDRVVEAEAIERVLAAARDGLSGVLALQAPGIGKTALLDNGVRMPAECRWPE